MEKKQRVAFTFDEQSLVSKQQLIDRGLWDIELDCPVFRGPHYCTPAAQQMDEIQPTASEQAQWEQDRQDARRFRFLESWNRQGRLFPTWRGELTTWVDKTIAAYPEWEDGEHQGSPLEGE